MTDYQVLVKLDSSNFPIGAKTDGDDIRFEQGGAELSYWFEMWDYAGKNAKIWVKVPSIPASTVTSIRMYYGNSSAGSSGSGDATFQFFDDFLGTSLDINKWQINVGSWSVSNGYAMAADYRNFIK